MPCGSYTNDDVVHMAFVPCFTGPEITISLRHSIMSSKTIIRLDCRLFIKLQREDSASVKEQTDARFKALRRLVSVTTMMLLSFVWEREVKSSTLAHWAHFECFRYSITWSSNRQGRPGRYNRHALHPTASSSSFFIEFGCSSFSAVIISRQQPLDVYMINHRIVRCRQDATLYVNSRT